VKLDCLLHERAQLVRLDGVKLHAIAKRDLADDAHGFHIRSHPTGAITSTASVSISTPTTSTIRQKWPDGANPDSQLMGDIRLCAPVEICSRHPRN